MRPNPYEEGCIRQIADILLLPLIKAKPSFRNLQDWLEDCFAIEDREIKRYRVKSTFTLPGKYYICATRAVCGLGSRVLKPNTVLWIRLDKTMPNRIDVEINRKKLGPQIFLLTQSEFISIKRKIEEKPLRERKRVNISWLKTQFYS